MKVTFGKNSVVTVQMTVKELNVIRYAISSGVEKLQSTAIYFKSARVSKDLQKSAKNTAKKCKAVQDSLEKATQQCIRKKKKP